MNFINLVIYLIVAVIFQRFFRIALDKSFSKKSSTLTISVSRIIVIIVFTIAIISLFSYSILIKEVGLTKRIIGGVLGFLTLCYFIHIIKNYLKN